MGSVSLKRIVKRFGNVQTIHGVDMEIEEGEFVVFVGPSGCGKSTLLRMIAGLESITDGDLLIDGEKVNQLQPSDRGIAMVFQSYALYPHMTVYENIAFSMKLQKMDKAQIHHKVMLAAKSLHLEALLDRRPSELSGGQCQRVAIGRSIVREPKVFLFDEPLSNLDAELRVQMRIEIARLHKELEATMIYVTHDQVEAMTLADKIVVLNAGKIEQVGAPLDLYNHPANQFVAGFIGSPKMNFMPTRIIQATGQTLLLDLGSDTFLQLPPKLASLKVGDLVTLGIRPEHIELGSAEGLNLTIKPMTVENLGSSSVIYGTFNGVNLAIELEGIYPNQKLEDIEICVNLDKIHFFDGQGRSI